ncbi:MAG: protein-L-isoaspartate O-methyltransferase [Hyphomicrobiales bacterium]|nr:protein-L-isoaspartate O-methyltransferase [Hyphomicrobiales bacterium]MCY4053297.1 protein-L-isoaspartate O-methyltransferase [Hyphomicrobiales bacterium]
MVEMDFGEARYHMAECQIRPDRVRDERILGAFATIERERFVPETMRMCAYADMEISLASETTGVRRVLLSPRVLARLADIADIESTHTVLDVGCGSGYSSAVLGRSAQLVVALEEDVALATWAEKLLLEEECENVSVVTGALCEGYPKQAPYDVIMLEGSVLNAPQGLLEQLSQGGRLVCVLSENVQGRGGYFLREGDSFAWFDCFDAAATPLPGFAPIPSFRFAT